MNFRRMFDPRLTEEYCGVAGMPWSEQDASGEIAGMAIGASLWGLFNNTGEFGYGITKPGTIGGQYGYVHLRWFPGSEVFDLARATGLPVKDWQDVIAVNMIGKRFYDETGANSPRTITNSSTRTFPAVISTPRTLSSTRTTILMPRSPGSATGTMGAGRSGPSSIPTQWLARAGIRIRQMSISTRLLLQRGNYRRTREEDRDEIPTRAYAARKS